MLIQLIWIKRGQAFELGDHRESNIKIEMNPIRELYLDMYRTCIFKLSTIVNTLKQRTLLTVGGPTSSGTNYPNLWDWYARIHPQMVLWFEQGGSFINNKV
jgi:hypothetical protein